MESKVRVGIMVTLLLAIAAQAASVNATASGDFLCKCKVIGQYITAGNLLFECVNAEFSITFVLTSGVTPLYVKMLNVSDPWAVFEEIRKIVKAVREIMNLNKTVDAVCKWLNASKSIEEVKVETVNTATAKAPTAPKTALQARIRTRNLLVE